MTAPLLQVNDLSVSVPGNRHDRHGAALVEHVGLRVHAGELVCLVGESGSGKTVTGRAILGLARENGLTVSGRIDFDGTDLLSLPAVAVRKLRGRRLALIPQEPSSALDPLFRVGDQVAEAVRLANGGSVRTARQTAIDLLDRVRIPEAAVKARQYPHELSGGMCQRVAIAMALAGQPRLIVADEPTSALDATVQLHILDLLDALRAASGTGMLLVTHDIAVAARADRIVVLYAGRIAEEGTASEVLGNPRHPYTQGLIAAVPTIDAARDRTTRLNSMPGGVPSPGRREAGCVFRPRCPLAGDGCQAPQTLSAVGHDHHAACWRVTAAHVSEVTL